MHGINHHREKKQIIGWIFRKPTSASTFAGLGLKKQRDFSCEEEESLGATGRTGVGGSLLGAENWRVIHVSLP